MSPELEHEVRSRLAQVIDPCSVGAGNAMNVVEMGLIKELRLEDGELSVLMCLTSPQCLMLEHFVAEARRVTADLPGVHRVVVKGDSGTEWSSARISPEARSRRDQHLQRMLPVVELTGSSR